VTSAPQKKPRAQLLLPLLNRAAFLDAYMSKSQDGGGLFVPGEIDVELGDDVDVELSFAEEQVRFSIRAKVAWKRTNAGRRALPPGVGIAFADGEQRTEQQILRFAEGKESVSHKDREKRWHINVDVKLDHAGQELTGITDDISEGGCYVLVDIALPVGSLVDVRLRAPGSLFGWMTLRAYVQWRRTQAGKDGMGLEFRFVNERQKAKLAKLVAVLRERHLRDVRVKLPRLSS
jgi:Tfp pilus assembly protein PilZ